MLSKHSIEAAEELARDAQASGITLSAQGQTPLSELFNHTLLAPGMAPAEQMSSSIEHTSNNPEHNERLDYFVKHIAEAASAHRDFARNVVLAAVRAVSEDLIGQLSDQPRDPVSEFTLKVKNLPAPLQNDAFVSSLGKDVAGPLIEPEGSFRFGARGPVALIEMLATGQAQFDEEIKIWAASLGDAFFLDLWDNLFRPIIESQPVVVRGLYDIIYDQALGADAATAVLLWVRRLAEDIPQDNGLDGDLYKRLIGQYKDVAAQVLEKFVQNEEAACQAGALIIHNDTRRKILTVRGEVYRPWLREGGKPEILFGLMLKSNLAATITQINGLREEALANWATFSSVAQVRYRNEYLARFRDALNISFYRDLRQPGEQEKEYATSHTEHISRVHALLEEELDRVSMADTKDIMRTVANVVAKTRFYYTDAHKFIKAMDDIAVADPKLSVEEVATLAGQEYVADFIADMIVAS